MHCFKNPANNKDIFIFGDYISVTANYDANIIAHIGELDQIAKDYQLDSNTQDLILSYHKRNKTIQDEDIYFDFSEWKISPKLVAFVTRNEKMIDILLNYHAIQAGEILASRGELASNYYVMLKFLHHKNEKVLVGLAKNPNLPPRFIVMLANNGYPQVRMGIAQQKDAPLKIIKMLSQDDSVYVRQAVASRATIPLEIVQQLAKDQHLAVRMEIAKRQDLPFELAEEMITNDDIKVLKNLLYFGHITPKLIQKAFDCHHSFHKTFVDLLIERKNVPIDWIPATAFDLILPIQRARNEALNEKELLTIISNGTLRERIEIASQEERLPDSVIHLLAHDESPVVRERLAEYTEYLPDEILLLLAQDPSEKVRIEISSRGLLPPNVIEILIKDENNLVREHIACYPDLTHEQIEKLSYDTNVFVVANVATYHKLPDVIVERLLQYQSSLIKERLIDHQNLNEKAIQILMNDKHDYIRFYLAKHKNELPVFCLSQLSEDIEPSIRVAIAKKKSLPNDVILKLLNDSEREVRRTACNQIYLTDELVQLFLQSENDASPISDEEKSRLNNSEVVLQNKELSQQNQ